MVENIDFVQDPGAIPLQIMRPRGEAKSGEGVRTPSSPDIPKTVLELEERKSSSLPLVQVFNSN